MKKIKKYVLIMISMAIGGLICIFGFTFAKYASTSVWDYYLKSRGFYFSSDYLGSNTINNYNTLWDGGSVHFNIKNNLNESVITDYDIDYRVTCMVEGDAATYTECHINGTSTHTQDGVLSSFQVCVNNSDDGIDASLLNKTNCELGGYDWTNQIAVKDLYFDVVLIDQQYELTDVVVNVTATSTAPYSKALRGNFTLHKSNAEEGEISLNYKNYSNYDRLIISNSYQNSKCVRVAWDSTKLIINEDGNSFNHFEVDESGYINAIVFPIATKDSVNYVFYSKSFDEIYNSTEFQLTEMEDDDCL